MADFRNDMLDAALAYAVEHDDSPLATRLIDMADSGLISIRQEQGRWRVFGAPGAERSQVQRLIAEVDQMIASAPRMQVPTFLHEFFRRPERTPFHEAANGLGAYRRSANGNFVEFVAVSPQALTQFATQMRQTLNDLRIDARDLRHAQKALKDSGLQYAVYPEKDGSRWIVTSDPQARDRIHDILRNATRSLIKDDRKAQVIDALSKGYGLGEIDVTDRTENGLRGAIDGLSLSELERVEAAIKKDISANKEREQVVSKFNRLERLVTYICDDLGWEDLGNFVEFTGKDAPKFQQAPDADAVRARLAEMDDATFNSYAERLERRQLSQARAAASLGHRYENFGTTDEPREGAKTNEQRAIDQRLGRDLEAAKHAGVSLETMRSEEEIAHRIAEGSITKKDGRRIPDRARNAFDRGADAKQRQVAYLRKHVASAPNPAEAMRRIGMAEAAIRASDRIRVLGANADALHEDAPSFINSTSAIVKSRIVEPRRGKLKPTLGLLLENNVFVPIDRIRELNLIQSNDKNERGEGGDVDIVSLTKPDAIDAILNKDVRYIRVTARADEHGRVSITMSDPRLVAERAKALREERQADAIARESDPKYRIAQSLRDAVDQSTDALHNLPNFDFEVIQARDPLELLRKQLPTKEALEHLEKQTSQFRDLASALEESGEFEVRDSISEDEMQERAEVQANAAEQGEKADIDSRFQKHIANKNLINAALEDEFAVHQEDDRGAVSRADFVGKKHAITMLPPHMVNIDQNYPGYIVAANPDFTVQLVGSDPAYLVPHPTHSIGAALPVGSYATITPRDGIGYDVKIHPEREQPRLRAHVAEYRTRENIPVAELQTLLERISINVEQEASVQPITDMTQNVMGLKKYAMSNLGGQQARMTFDVLAGRGDVLLGLDRDKGVLAMLPLSEVDPTKMYAPIAVGDRIEAVVNFNDNNYNVSTVRLQRFNDLLTQSLGAEHNQQLTHNYERLAEMLLANQYGVDHVVRLDPRTFANSQSQFEVGLRTTDQVYLIQPDPQHPSKIGYLPIQTFTSRIELEDPKRAKDRTAYLEATAHSERKNFTEDIADGRALAEINAIAETNRKADSLTAGPADCFIQPEVLDVATSSVANLTFDSEGNVVEMQGNDPGRYGFNDFVIYANFDAPYQKTWNENDVRAELQRRESDQIWEKAVFDEDQYRTSPYVGFPSTTSPIRAVVTDFSEIPGEDESKRDVQLMHLDATEDGPMYARFLNLPMDDSAVKFTSDIEPGQFVSIRFGTTGITVEPDAEATPLVRATNREQDMAQSQSQPLDMQTA